MAAKKYILSVACLMKSGEKYFFVKAVCLICSKSTAVLKDYNLQRHYKTKHQSKYLKLSDKLHTVKFYNLQIKKIFSNK